MRDSIRDWIYVVMSLYSTLTQSFLFVFLSRSLYFAFDLKIKLRIIEMGQNMPFLKKDLQDESPTLCCLEIHNIFLHHKTL